MKDKIGSRMEVNGKGKRECGATRDAKNHLKNHTETYYCRSFLKYACVKGI